MESFNLTSQRHNFHTITRGSAHMSLDVLTIFLIFSLLAAHLANLVLNFQVIYIIIMFCQRFHKIEFFLHLQFLCSPRRCNVAPYVLWLCLQLHRWRCQFKNDNHHHHNHHHHPHNHHQHHHHPHNHHRHHHHHHHYHHHVCSCIGGGEHFKMTIRITFLRENDLKLTKKMNGIAQYFPTIFHKILDL